ncbi:hypothetical protein [Paenarthrobacter nicotinovorans]|uniref:hypothetical protein n=1 Tax=Paenarthrobacter nicotinovorans TaxID=29320 RepID=UPI0011A01A3C|nr:hypothetical protein [Paenarthrobacter nicotinovorans]
MRAIACVPVTAALLLGALAPTAWADSSTETLGNASQLIQNVVPEVLHETDRSTQPSDVVVEGGTEHRAPVIEPVPVSETAEKIRIQPKQAKSETREDSGIAVFRTESNSTKIYVQPTLNGVRLLSAIGDASSPRAFSYEIDAGDNVTAQERPDGGIRLFAANGAPLGAFEAPWAVDAAGKKLNTTYTWEDGILTQSVEVTSSTKYPVLADPSWGYTTKIEIGATTGTAVRNLLHGCFNCNFPIDGAPQAFPTYGQYLPLTVAGANFNCKFMYETPPTSNLYDFTFEALPGHVDGAGSTIDFTFYKAPGESSMYLYAQGWIVGMDPGPGRYLYAEAASKSWVQFAQNVKWNLGIKELVARYEISFW